MCTTGDMAHIDTILKLLPHTRQHVDVCVNIISMCAVSPVVHTSNISSCQKKTFSFLVALKNSIKVGPLVFLL